MLSRYFSGLAVIFIAAACEVLDNDIDKHTDKVGDIYIGLDEVAEIFSALPVNKPCHSYQGFQPSKCKFLSSGGTIPAIQQPLTTSFPVSTEDLGGLQRQPSTTSATPYGK